MPVNKAIYLITTLIFPLRLELNVARGNDNPPPAEDCHKVLLSLAKRLATILGREEWAWHGYNISYYIAYFQK